MAKVFTVGTGLWMLRKSRPTDVPGEVESTWAFRYNDDLGGHDDPETVSIRHSSDVKQPSFEVFKASERMKWPDGFVPPPPYDQVA